tara:strand:+ start:202 stop:381 length:180 start_codon:yes stop_codon:yes gene_type:complete
MPSQTKHEDCIKWCVEQLIAMVYEQLDENKKKLFTEVFDKAQADFQNECYRRAEKLMKR